MGKVVKIFLNRGFVPVNNSIFKIGTKVDFDCYVQRFNGYFILIEAGTILDEKLHKLVTQKNLQIFIENKSYKNYKIYVEKNRKKDNFEKNILILKEEIDKSLKIEKFLAEETLFNEKLKYIYNQGKNLINAWLLDKEKNIVPIDAFDSLADSIVMLIYDNNVTLSNLTEFLAVKYTLATHLLNVAFFTSLIANQIDIDIMDKKKLVLSALLHDIGKTEVDESLLDKPDYLNEEEFEIVKKHVVESIIILKKAGLKDRLIIDGIRGHHEMLDGSGYPNGFKEIRISEFGQILAVCDVFDALVTIKPYRGAYTTYNALKLINEEYKNKLNMKFVNIFIKLLK